MDWIYLKDLKEYILRTFSLQITTDNIHYLGNPYELYWNDVNDTNRISFLLILKH